MSGSLSRWIEPDGTLTWWFWCDAVVAVAVLIAVGAAAAFVVDVMLLR